MSQGGSGGIKMEPLSNDQIDQLTKDDEIEITILNWCKYNPRELKTMSWIRIQSDIFFSRTFDHLESLERLVFFFVLTYSGLRNSDHFIIKLSAFEHHSQIAISVIISAIKKLQRLEILIINYIAHVQIGNEREPFVTKMCLTKRNERNETNETNETNGTERERVESSESGPKTERLDSFASYDAPPPHKLALLWNEFSQELPKVNLAMSKGRLKKCELRWKETPSDKDPLAHWQGVITRLAKSDFCNGKNDRSWIATFDFLLQPDAQFKIMEGKYDNRERVSNIRNYGKELSDSNNRALAAYLEKLDSEKENMKNV
jgi:hypothetical protein